MADNTNLNVMAGGDTISTDDLGSTKVQRVKVQYGADGSATDVNTSTPLPVTVANTGANATAIKVDNSAVTQPVSGTVSAAQSGTWTVQPGNTANTTAWKVDGSAVTQPVSAASLPLPSTAATSTKQSDGTQKSQIVDGSGNVIASTSNALNVAITSGGGSGGTASSFGSADPATGTAVGFSDGSNMREARVFDADTGAGTQYVQGVVLRQSASGGSNEVGTSTTPMQVSLANTAANATAVKTDGSAVTQPVSGTVTTTPPSNASTNVAQVAGTTTDTNSGVKSAGTLRVVLATDQPALTNKLLVTPDSVALPANQSVNQSQIAGTTTDTNSGNKSAGTQRVVLATDQPALTNALKVDGSAVTQPVSLTSTTVTGTVAVTESGTWTVQPGNTANSTPWLTTNTPATSGGYTTSRTLSAASTNATSVKASAGQVFGWYITNATTSAKFVKLYNKASAPTVGTDTPTQTLLIPANTTASGGAGTNVEFVNGIAFSTGIALAITGLVADADTTAVAANDVIVNLFYK